MGSPIVEMGAGGDEQVDINSDTTAPDHGEDRASERVSGVTDAYARLLGRRLRQIRQQKGYSLTAVESRSGEEFKASVLGAYERGERTIAVTRLMRLADQYSVPLDQLLPGAGDTQPATPEGRPTMRLDLTKVARLGGPEGDLLRRQLGLVQLSRQDFNGRVMSIRHDDQRVLAGIFGVREDRIWDHLAERGLLTGP